jgi:chromosome segregation ATPase
MAGARMSHANMMQKVEEICYDLERRCDSVEAPLRAVEEERNKISLEAEDLKRHNGHLMLELQQASSTIAERQQCISRLEIHAETASARIEELTASFDAARSELEDQRRAFQDTANRERESARTRELDLIASMAEKEEQLDQLQEESNRRSEESDQLRTTLNIVSKERDVAVERNNCLEQDTSRLGGIVEEDRLLLTRKDEEIERLQAAKEDMETLMDTIQSKVGQSSWSGAIGKLLKNLSHS